MKEIRLHEGELNVMELLWSNKALAAKDISKIIKEYIGWEKNTTYTVIKRLIDKGAITREDPGFICRANVTKRKIQEIETKALLDQMYNGSLENFMNSYLANQKLTGTEIAELQRIISMNGRQSSCLSLLTLLDKLQFFKERLVFLLQRGAISVTIYIHNPKLRSCENQ